MSAAPLSAVHIIAGLDAHYGGPSYSVPRLCCALAEGGAEPALLTVADAGAPEAATETNGYAERHYAWDLACAPVVSRLRLSRGLTHAMRQRARRAHVFHNHGLWLAPNVISALVARRARVPLVLSPRGMLSAAALAMSSVQKQLFWRIAQKPALTHLACVHATSRQEHEDVRRAGIRVPVAVIPNGIDLPELAALAPKVAVQRTVLYLGRFNPIKSLDTLIEAWGSLAPERRAGWRLRLVGPDEGGCGARLGELIAARGLGGVSIEPAVYGDAKLSVYGEASLFVLPSRSENFGLTVAEALACGTPVICSRGAPWSGLETHRCGWWTEHGAAPLAAALEVALATPANELAAMGARGRMWMERDFSWTAAAKQLIDVYRWLAFGSERPAVIVEE